MPSLVNPLRAAVVLAGLTGGCVIPVGPQFDDSQQNYAPYVESSMPTVGEIFTPSTTDDGRSISVTLSDQNLTDELFIRFLVDYPGTDTTSPAHLVLSLQQPPTGMPSRSPVHVQPSCQALHLAMGLHRFVMAVADRAFLDAVLGQDVDPEAPLDSVPDGAKRIRVLWTINCP